MTLTLNYVFLQTNKVRMWALICLLTLEVVAIHCAKINITYQNQGMCMDGEQEKLAVRKCTSYSQSQSWVLERGKLRMVGTKKCVAGSGHGSTKLEDCSQTNTIFEQARKNEHLLIEGRGGGGLTECLTLVYDGKMNRAARLETCGNPGKIGYQDIYYE
jgi:hypothetical protein